MAEPEYRPTTIRHITKSEDGRFRGHYLVGLEILAGESKNENQLVND